MSRRAWVTPDAAPDGFTCRGLLSPIGQPWQAILTGALLPLADSANFETAGGISESQAASIFALTVFSWLEGCCPMFAGQIALSARSSLANDFWLLCDGAAYNIAQYPALYNAIGETFGDDGEGTFRVPDLRGVFPLGASSTYALASAGGEATHTLTEDELPWHVHSVKQIVGSGGTKSGFASTSTGSSEVYPSSGAVGSDEPHNNMPPYIAINFVIFTGGQ